jgi:hypothetical protein
LVEAFDVCANTVSNFRTRFTKRGLDAVLCEKR